jgi:flavodoxin
MEPRVLYFTRSGNSERIAQKIADRTGCGVSRITDDKNWKGLIGFLRGGSYAARQKTTNPQITPEAHLSDFSRVVIVGPVWAGKAAPAVYSLLLKEKEQLHKVCLVLTSGGGETEPAFQTLEANVGAIPYKFGIPKNRADEDQIAARAAETLKE